MRVLYAARTFIIVMTVCAVASSSTAKTAFAAEASLRLPAVLPAGADPVFRYTVPPTIGSKGMCDPRGRVTAFFCRGAPEYKPLAFTDALLATLTSINVSVNHSIIPLDDSSQWKVPEHWNRPIVQPNGWMYDDCDGYVIEKWYRLVELGMPLSAMYPLYVLLPRGYGHLVLAVLTDSGTLILDNLTDSIVPFAHYEQIYAKRPSPGVDLSGSWQGTGPDALDAISVSGR